MVTGNMIISIKYSKGTDVQEFAFVILAGIPIKDFQIHDMGGEDTEYRQRRTRIPGKIIIIPL